jgi:hypothetical protein
MNFYRFVLLRSDSPGKISPTIKAISIPGPWKGGMNQRIVVFSGQFLLPGRRFREGVRPINPYEWVF